MTRILLVTLLLALAASSVLADKVDRAVEADMKAHPVPGLALEVIRHGKCVKRAAYGFANLEWRTPVTPQTVFEIGSVTKQFTSAGILLLMQDGKLSVDDKISTRLAGTPESWKDITIRHLLTHTSGIPNYTRLDGFELRRHLSQAEFIKQIGSYPLDFQPGARFSYCNSGFNLLAFIIENVSGTNYWAYMSNRVFTPLGMKSTTRRDPPALVLWRASGYETNADGRYINRDYDLTDLFGAGAIVSTIDDMAKWNASLDAQTLLNAETEKTMWTPVKLNSGKTYNYGFGWFLSPYKGHKDIWHSGSTSGFSSSIERFPEDGLAVIVLTNSNEDGVGARIAKEVAALYFDK